MPPLPIFLAKPCSGPVWGDLAPHYFPSNGQLNLGKVEQGTFAKAFGSAFFFFLDFPSAVY